MAAATVSQRPMPTEACSSRSISGTSPGRIGDRRDVVAADDGGDDQADGPGDLGDFAALAPEADDAAGTDEQAEGRVPGAHLPTRGRVGGSG
jgi:hypothetical protein